MLSWKPSRSSSGCQEQQADDDGEHQSAGRASAAALGRAQLLKEPED